MTDVRRARTQVVVEGVLGGILLGVVLGIVWWLLTPPVRWTVTADGAVPAAIGHDDWFAADGWFLGLGLVLGVGLTGLLWPRARSQPVALAVGVAVGAALLSLTGWALGGLLGPADPASLVGLVPAGDVVEGALGLRAPGVLLGPMVGALAVLGVLLASASVADEQVVPGLPAAPPPSV